MYIVCKQRFDFEGYLVGSAWGKVGPFLTFEEAAQWVKDTPAYSEGIQEGEKVRILDPLFGVRSPNNWPTPKL